MKKLIIAIVMFYSFSTANVFAQSADLEVISIDPAKSPIVVGETSNLILAVNQNGPGNLPVGSARISIAIDPTTISWVIPLIVTDDCGNVWTVQTQNVTPTTSQIQIRNNNAILANGAGCGINIPIRGVAVGTSSITVSSTVFGAGISDPNGTNQGATSSIAVEPPLPVTLVSFNVQKENQTALLKWATTMETNSDYFEIQHSVTGKEWANVDRVASHGESSSLKSYSYQHDAPVNGENLYRLKMVDKDQTFAYSRIQSVKFDGIAKDLTVYPNPVADKLFLRDFKEITNVQINNLNGQAVYQSNSSTTGEINISNITPGMYIVKISRANGVESSQKIVVRK